MSSNWEDEEVVGEVVDAPDDEEAERRDVEDVDE